MENITGGCLCGAVKYTVTSKPVVTRECWCNLCQKLASGNATINMAFPKDDITITGALSDYASAADDGNKMHRLFCPSCGVHLFSEAEERPNMIVVRAGTLDDAESINVEAVIWTSTAPSWARLNTSVPHCEHQPPAPKIK